MSEEEKKDEEEESGKVPALSDDMIHSIFPNIYHLFEDESIVDYNFEDCETRNNRMGPYYEKDVAAAIIKSYGNFSTIARLLGRSRTKVRNHILANFSLKTLYDDVRESLWDGIEERMIIGAYMGDGASQRTIMQTQGKDRGYTTRKEITGAGGRPIQVVSREALDGMSADEIKRALDTIGPMLEARVVNP